MDSGERGTRVLRGSSAVLSPGPLSGVPVSGTVVINDAGGNPIDAGVISITGGVASYALSPSYTALVNQLTATWTVTLDDASVETAVSYYSVVGALLFTVAEARAWDGGAMANVTDYPDAAITEGRDRVTDAFESILGLAVGLSYGREYLDGEDTSELWLSHSRVKWLRSIGYREYGGTAYTPYTPDQLAAVEAYPSGQLRQSTGWYFLRGVRNYVIDYEHGFQPIPFELKTAGLRVLRNTLVHSPLDDRATSQSFDGMTYSLATAGRSGAFFGIPFVDEVLNRLRAVGVW